MTRHGGKLLRVAILIAVLVALVAFARNVNWTEAWRAMRTASLPLILAAALANIASVALKGVRWWIFLRPIGVTSLGLALRGFFAGAALNAVFIANSGEAARVVFVSRAANVTSARVLATLALERFFETFGYVLLLTAAATFLALPPALTRMRPAAIAALVVMAAILVFLATRSDRAATPEAPSSEVAGIWPRVRQYLSRFLRTLTGISTAPRFAAATGVTMAVWALQAASYHLTAVAAGLSLSLVGSIAALLAVNVSFAIRATPGNVGVFQAIYALTAAAFGIDKDAAIGVALMIQFQQQIPVILLGLAAAPEMLRQRGDGSRSQ